VYLHLGLPNLFDFPILAPPHTQQLLAEMQCRSVLQRLRAGLWLTDQW